MKKFTTSFTRLSLFALSSFLVTSAAMISPTSARASEIKCAYSCRVTDQNGHLLNAEDFRGVGGYTETMNTACLASLPTDSGTLYFMVDDYYGYKTELAILVNDIRISSIAPGNRGEFSLSYRPMHLDLTCRR